MGRRDRRGTGSREIYLEYYTLGNSVKVSAIDSETGVEVSIAGPRNASRAELERIAVQKLKRALERR